MASGNRISAAERAELETLRRENEELRQDKTKLRSQVAEVLTERSKLLEVVLQVN